MKSISIYTDGAVSPNPGPGGWAAVVVAGSDPIRLSGGLPHTTNNFAELSAILEAFKWLLANGNPPAILYSDSQYAINCVSKWAEGWERKGWMIKQRPVKNLAIVQTLYYLSKAVRVEFRWVSGHSGNHWNEVADALAVSASKRSAVRRSCPAAIPMHLTGTPSTLNIMATATLTSAAPTTSFATVPGQVYVLGASGSFAGGEVTLSKALAGSPAIFATMADASWQSPFDVELIAPGSILRATVKNVDRNGPASTNINLELTPRV